MKRRAFLKFLGLAPVAAAVPAMALPRAEKPTEIDYDALNRDIEGLFIDARAAGPSRIVIDPDAPLGDVMRDIEGFDAWWNRVKT